MEITEDLNHLVFKLNLKTPSVVRVYKALITHWLSEKNTYMRFLDNLAEEVGISLASVKRAIRDLHEKGLIEKKRTNKVVKIDKNGKKFYINIPLILSPSAKTVQTLNKVDTAHIPITAKPLPVSSIFSRDAAKYISPPDARPETAPRREAQGSKAEPGGEQGGRCVHARCGSLGVVVFFKSLKQKNKNKHTNHKQVRGSATARPRTRLSRAGGAPSRGNESWIGLGVRGKGTYNQFACG